MELRPLGIGEIFDRALTLYVRNFLPFLGIVAAPYAALAPLHYVASAHAEPAWDRLVAVFEHLREGAHAAALTPYFATPDVAMPILIGLSLFIAWPLMLGACTIGVARLYRGREVGFRSCYRESLLHWPRICGLLLLGGFIVAALYAVLWHILWLLSLLPLGLVLCLAVSATVVEDRAPFVAIGSAFARVFDRRGLGRATVFLLAWIAMLFGGDVLLYAVAIPTMTMHWLLPEVLLTTLVQVVYTPILALALVVYYFDVRVRREGLDVEAGLDRLASDAVTTSPILARPGSSTSQ